MLKYILLGLIALIVIVLIAAATRPDTFRVSRSIVIAAPAAAIFPLIEDFRRWNQWSPYEKKDPQMKRSFSGPASGAGAIYAFEGDNNVGSGQLEITEVEAPGHVALTLDMIKPMEGHNVIDFTLAPRDGGTEVTWAMHGAQPFIGKVMGLVFNMDKMIGNDFEAGLASLKTAVESAPR